ncbi:disks large-associated protein 1-like isoform X2 [Varroa jacobsoni]|uniref:disks large-associated protein 1-like isoform X1 n=1 Tax=Varroa jacobsoni TaxID=62625 RepID=UPI000BF43D24|nr:disks large-associated protein 1-like isoform X1 [Varroa jacobsoni]XP_022686330.1 disks large-associated protein 1-like isoform X2 [Varroa jacobsoni]
MLLWCLSRESVAISETTRSASSAEEQLSRKMSAGHEFLEKLETVEAEIKVESVRMAAIQEKLPDENREEISSRIDMAIGSANLILAGKCKQFRDLCQKNINENSGIPTESVDGTKSGSSEFPTRREDLEGFWEMISMPIQKVRDGFASIERLKENGWKENEDTKPQVKKTISTVGPKCQGFRKKPLASKNDNNNTPSQADIDRREKAARQKEEARQRFLEYKKEKAAARDKISSQNDDDDTDVVRSE